MKIGNAVDYLKEHSIMPSYQRMKIFEYLLKYKNHPTVDMIYQKLGKEIPSLSKTTVYNTLKLFIENKIVQLVTIEENETRYDADTSVHGHFKCEKCGKVYDFDIDSLKISKAIFKNVEIKEQHVYLKGVCNKQNIHKK